MHWLASLAKLDATPTSDQEVTGSSPPGPHSFMVIDHEIFSTVFLFPSTGSRNTVVSFWQRMCTILVNCLGD